MKKKEDSGEGGDQGIGIPKGNLVSLPWRLPRKTLVHHANPSRVTRNSLK